MPTHEQVIAMLKTINDPELNVDIWTMGLIYDITIRNDATIHIGMTFTSPLCPSGETIKAKVDEKMRLLGFTQREIQVTFDPPWQPPLALKNALGL